MIDQPVNIKAQLGCGTLIIIAIIVMLFSGGNESRQLRRELDDLNRKLDRLEQKIDDLSRKLGRAPSSTPAPPKVRRDRERSVPPALEIRAGRGGLQRPVDPLRNEHLVIAQA